MIKHEIILENMNQNDKKIAQEFLSYDFDSEIEWIKKHVINKIKSPIVFCNNDLTHGNVLIRNEILDKINDLNNKNHLKSKEIIDNLIDELVVIIDFEFCAYNFRGCELANYFMAHQISYFTPEPPHFIVDRNKYPSQEHRRIFIREYLNKLKQIKGNLDDEIDNEDHILKEVEAYQIGHVLFWSLLDVRCTLSPLIQNFKIDFWVSK